MPGVPGDLIPPGVPPQVPQQPNSEDPPLVNPDPVMPQVSASSYREANCYVQYSQNDMINGMAQLAKLSVHCCYVSGAAFRLCICVCTSYLHALQVFLSLSSY